MPDDSPVLDDGQELARDVAPRARRVAVDARFLALLLAVTLGAATFAVAFRVSLTHLYRSAYGAGNVVDALSALTPWTRVWVLVVGAALAGAVRRWFVTQRQDVSNVMEAVALGRLRLSFRTTCWRVVSSWIAIGAGMSIGREGPLIEFGGALGAAASRRVHVDIARTRVLIAAGTAAGFAAAYNTPFAAVLFVIETIVGVAALEALLPVMLGTALATFLTREVAGPGPIYGARSFVVATPAGLLACIGVGIAAACAATAFAAVLRAAERFVEAHPMPQPWRAAIGGLIVGLLAIAFPHVVGNGYEPLNHVLDGRLAAAALAWLLLTKIVATTASVASGVPGGVFTPVLLIGGAGGALLAPVLAHLPGMAAVDPGGFALVGMAATTAATIHAPLTAAIMVFELSGDYALVLPLVLATVVATWMARWLGGVSLYQRELRRRGLGWELTLDGRVVRQPRDEGAMH